MAHEWVERIRRVIAEEELKAKREASASNVFVAFQVLSEPFFRTLYVVYKPSPPHCIEGLLLLLSCCFQVERSLIKL